MPESPEMHTSDRFTAGKSDAPATLHGFLVYIAEVPEKKGCHE
jgi:hypothetical protein